MLDLVFRDAVEHRVVWAGAFLVTAVTSMFTTVCFNAMLVAAAGADAVFTGQAGREALLKTAGNLLFLSGGPAVVVLVTVLGGVAVQTRSFHALWRIGGASPRQVLWMFTLQVLVVSGCGAFAGAMMALPFQEPVNVILGRGMLDDASTPPGVLPLLGVAGSVVLVSIWAVSAGLLPAVRASRTSPLSGRRPDQPRKHTWTGVILFVAFVQLPLLVPLVAVPVSEPAEMGVVTLLPAGQAMVITAALCAPHYLGYVIRAWTRVIGLNSWTPWRIARHMAVTRAEQSTASVVPLMVGIGVFASFDVVGAAAKNVGEAELNMFGGLLMLTPVGVIGAIGSAAVVFMASRQRGEDLTALRVAGASPADSLAVFACEAFIYVVTALVVALGPAAGTVGLMSLALARWGAPLDLSGASVTGSAGVVVLGGLTTLVIVVGGGAMAWRRPLCTTLVTK